MNPKQSTSLVTLHLDGTNLQNPFMCQALRLRHRVVREQLHWLPISDDGIDHCWVDGHPHVVHVMTCRRDEIIAYIRLCPEDDVSKMMMGQDFASIAQPMLKPLTHFCTSHSGQIAEVTRFVIDRTRPRWRRAAHQLFTEALSIARRRQWLFGPTLFDAKFYPLFRAWGFTFVSELTVHNQGCVATVIDLHATIPRFLGP